MKNWLFAAIIAVPVAAAGQSAPTASISPDSVVYACAIDPAGPICGADMTRKRAWNISDKSSTRRLPVPSPEPDLAGLGFGPAGSFAIETASIALRDAPAPSPWEFAGLERHGAEVALERARDARERATGRAVVASAARPTPMYWDFAGLEAITPSMTAEMVDFSMIETASIAPAAAEETMGAEFDGLDAMGADVADAKARDAREAATRAAIASVARITRRAEMRRDAPPGAHPAAIETATANGAGRSVDETIEFDGLDVVAP